MYFPSPTRTVLALSCALTLLAGCQATAGLSSLPAAPAAQAADPETRALLDAVSGMSRAGATLEQQSAPQPAQPGAGYAVKAVSAPPQAVVRDGYYAGPFPAAAGVPTTYALRATGGWLVANPVVATAGTTITTTAYWTPGGTTAATSAITTKVEAAGLVTTDLYTAPWSSVSDLPEFFKAKLSLPAGYAVHQAEETYKVYTNGTVTGSAVGYSWQVLAGDATIAWVRAQQVTQADGTKVDHWEISSDYRVVGGKNQAVKSAYGNLWEATGTANAMTRTLDAATGVATSAGTWQDLVAGQTVAIQEVAQPTGAISRTLTRQMPDGRTLRVIERYNADGTGSGTVAVDGMDKGTVTWGAGFLGTVTLNGAGAPYVASRLSIKARPKALDVAPAAGNQMATVAGTMEPLPGTLATHWALTPGVVTRDAAGNTFLVDVNQVRKIGPDGTITNVAGNGAYGFSGDGGPATAAKFNQIRGLAVDGAGNLYVSDSDNFRIRKVDAATGLVSTIAGTGDYGNSGDGGPATGAKLATPHGLAIDHAGNVYVASKNVGLIRKISPDGTISTVAGNGTNGYGGDGGPATSAALNYPEGVAVDAAGNLYIADYAGHRIRKVAAATGVITSLIGNGYGGAGGDGGPAESGTVSWPSHLGVDARGNVYFVQGMTGSGTRVRKIDATTGLVDTVAGNGAYSYGGDGGPATSAAVYGLTGLAVNPDGSFVVSANQRLRQVDAAGTITTVAGNGSVAFSGDGGSALAAQLRNPVRVVADAAGNLYMADPGAHRVRRVDAATGVITTVAGSGATDNNYSGGFSGDGGPANRAELQGPWGVALDAAGNLYIADTGNSRIRKVDTRGVITTVVGTSSPGFSGDGGPGAGAQLSYPMDVAVDAAGNVYIADLGNYRVRKLDAATGKIATIAGSGSTTYGGDGGAALEAGLPSVAGLDVDGAGNVYIACYENQVVRKVNAATGTIDRVAGQLAQWGNFGGDGGAATSARLSYPYDVAVDTWGNMYIADSMNHRLRRVDPAGVITTFAGTGTTGSGADGPATSTRIQEPSGVAVDSHGHVYYASQYDKRVRKVH